MVLDSLEVLACVGGLNTLTVIYAPVRALILALRLTPVRRIVRSAHDLHTNIWETHNGAKHAPLPGIPARGSAATKVMARMSNDAASMGIHPSVICKLPGGERGCKLVLFASKYQFTVQVRVFRSCTTISIFAEPLDGPLHCRIPVFEDEDSERSWSRGLRAMLEFEGVAYYDSYWAQEQQQGEGGDGVEAP